MDEGKAAITIGPLGSFVAAMAHDMTWIIVGRVI
jgi:hypothetical protein